MNKITRERKIELLQSSKWNYKDIADWCECSKSKANQIARLARDKGGGIKFFTSYVLRDTVLEILGVDLERELKILYEKL